jgi:hypothetical protein
VSYRDGFTLSREEVEECTVACGCLVRVVQAGEGFAVEPIRSCMRHEAYCDGWQRGDVAIKAR